MFGNAGKQLRGKINLSSLGSAFRTKAAIVAKSVQESIAENLGLEEGLARMGSFPSPAEYVSNVQHALESWPDSLHALSVRSTGLKLTHEEHLHLTKWWGEGGIEKLGLGDVRGTWNKPRAALEQIKMGSGAITDDKVIMGLVDRMNVALADLPYERPFIKLGTRSGKDSPLHLLEDGRVSSGEQALLLILTSRRMFADLATDEVYYGNTPEDPKIAEERLMQAEAKKMPIADFAAMLQMSEDEAEAIRSRPLSEPPSPHMPHIWFREYERFQRQNEFRCFINNGKYVGATQYHDVYSVPHTVVDEVTVVDEETGLPVVEQRKRVENQIIKADPHRNLVQHGWTYDRILRQYAEIFKAAATTMKSAIYDVVVERESERVVLLETNPANSRTFPGLKDWSRPETFNGELDWVVDPVDFTREEGLKLTQQNIAELRIMADARKRALEELEPTSLRSR